MDEKFLFTQMADEIQAILDQSRPLAVEVTTAQLINLSSTGHIEPGQLYRVTDYTLYVDSQDGRYSSGEHQFDILLLGATPTTFFSRAGAAQHAGSSYFNATGPSRWQLEVGISQGRLVVLWMRDENGNEAPYDFKNLMFRRVRVTAAAAPYDKIKGLSDIGIYMGIKNPSGASVNHYPQGLGSKAAFTFDDNDTMYYYTFSQIYGTQGSYTIEDISYDGNRCSHNVIARNDSANTPNNIVFILGGSGAFHNNTFEAGCSSMTFGLRGGAVACCKFGANSYGNTFATDDQNPVDIDTCTFGSFMMGCYLQGNFFNSSFGSYCDRVFVAGGMTTSHLRDHIAQCSIEATPLENLVMAGYNAAVQVTLASGEAAARNIYVSEGVQSVDIAGNNIHNFFDRYVNAADNIVEV